MSRLTDTLNLLHIVVLLCILAVPAALWWYLSRPPQVVPQAQPSGRVEMPAPVKPDRSSVPVAWMEDSSAVEVSDVAVDQAESYAGTATIETSEELPRAAIGIRSVPPGWLYEFRGRRYDQFEVDVLPAPGTSPESIDVLYTPQRLPLVAFEAEAQLAMGYTGRPAVVAAVTLLRVTGVHAGAAIGLELGTADVLAGPGLSITPFRTATVGAWYDVNGARLFATLGLRF